MEERMTSLARNPWAAVFRLLFAGSGMPEGASGTLLPILRSLPQGYRLADASLDTFSILAGVPLRMMPDENGLS